MRNPVILAGHSHKLDDGKSPVVGSCVKAWVDKAAFWILIEFAKTALGQEYWELYRDKHQRAFSIGFRVKQGEDQIIDGQRVYVVSELELFEISCVPVGANPDALSKSAQAKKAFVAAKKQENWEEKFLADYRKEHPGFDAECQEFADIILGHDSHGEIMENAGDISDEIPQKGMDDFSALIRGGEQNADGDYAALVRGKGREFEQTSVLAKGIQSDLFYARRQDYGVIKSHDGYVDLR